jgi:hypothetical protein
MSNLLGFTAKDKITGLEGVIVAQTSYLTGCDRVSIQPRDTKDGKTADWVSFDIGIVDIVTSVPRITLNVVEAEVGKKTTGGPQPSVDRY